MFGVMQEVSLCLRIFTLHCKHKCTHLPSFIPQIFMEMFATSSSPALGDTEVKEIRILMSSSVV